MIKLILENLLELLIVLPIIILALKRKDSETFKILMVFMAFFLLNQILLYLPIIYPETHIINWNSHWNWSGKIYAILGSILFLVFYRKFELKDYFLTFKQNKKFIKNGTLLILGILILKLGMIYFLSSPKTWHIETVLYQFTMPGINEEIAYRGIMLGLLTKVLKSKNRVFNVPVLVTAILFGLAHGFMLTDEYSIVFKPQAFLRTMAYGLIWGWITLKSGSILLTVISHNLGNGLGNLIEMR